MTTETIEAGRDQIYRSIEATESAIRTIRDGDVKRRQVSLELRNLQITMYEDFDKIKSEMQEFDELANRERIANAAWVDEKLAKATRDAHTALSSPLLKKDVELLEKKIGHLKQSLAQLTSSYAAYDRQIDMSDLQRQVTEMAYRTEKRETELVAAKFGASSPSSLDLNAVVAEPLRCTIETLLALKCSNSVILEEARRLAADLKIYRDVAENGQFDQLVMKEEKAAAAAASKSLATSSETSHESEFSSTLSLLSSSSESSNKKKLGAGRERASLNISQGGSSSFASSSSATSTSCASSGTSASTGTSSSSQMNI